MARAGFNLSAAILGLSFFIPMAMAAQLVVGDSHGWSVPPSSVGNYSSWAEKHSFYVGDILLFNYSAYGDDVLEVNRTDYISCKFESATAVHTGGRTEIRLENPGPHYFICGVPLHCLAGQKLSIIAIPSPDPAPAQPNSSMPSSNAPAQPNSSMPPSNAPAQPNFSLVSSNAASICGTNNPISSPKFAIAASIIILMIFYFLLEQFSTSNSSRSPLYDDS